MAISDFVNSINKASQSSHVNPYLLAVSAAIQQGAATLSDPQYDYQGNLMGGTIHFPGEENFQYQSGRRINNGSQGLSVGRDYITGRAENNAGRGLVDPNTPLYSGDLSAGDTSGSLEGLSSVHITTDSSGKIISQPASNTLNFRSSSGPTGFSQLATALFPVIANIALPGVGTAFSAINSLAQGADVGDVLKNAAINQAISQGLGALTPTDTVDLNAATSGLQDVYGGNLPIEDITSAFDATGPLADTTAGLDTAFVQDMSQGIETAAPEAATTTSLPSTIDVTPEQVAQMEASNAAMEQTPTAIDEAGQLPPTTPAENPFLAGMEETTATEGAGVAGAENPTGTTVTAPETTAQPTVQDLTPQQIYNLLKMSAGLFGGGGALAAVAKGLTGGSTGIPGTGTALPTIQAPTPFTGTYSGINPNDAAYYQQVQQNYNRLFPTSNVNVAAPLESWYQTKFVPDTTISKKLFGV